MLWGPLGPGVTVCMSPQSQRGMGSRPLLFRDHRLGGRDSTSTLPAPLPPSAPMDFALNAYMSHAGLRLREARPSGAAEKAQAAPDKDKWLPFFPKTKKVTELSRKYLLVRFFAGAGRGHAGKVPPPHPCP